MTTFTKRSGWTNVRVCLDCHEPIKEGDRCGCLETHTYARGLAVAVCADEARERLVRLDKVERIGNRGFRLGGTAEWYDFGGQPMKGTRYYVRPQRAGDAEFVERREQAKQMLTDVERWEDELRLVKVKAAERATDASVALRAAHNLESRAAALDAGAADTARAAANKVREKAEGERAELLRQAAAVDPDARAEEARASSEKASRASAEAYRKSAAERRENSMAKGAEVHPLLARAAELRAQLDALPPDVQGVRLLGDRAALRAYLTF